MRAVVVLALVACLVATAATAATTTTTTATTATKERHLVVLRGLIETEASALVRRHDVRGVFGELTLLLATRDEITALRRQYPNAFELGPYTEGRFVAVLEKQTLASDTPAKVEAWAAATKKIVASDDNLDVLLSLPSHIIIAAKTGDVAALKHLQLSGDTEILPLASRALSSKNINDQRLQRLRKTFRVTERRADIPSLLNNITTSSIVNFIEYLSGELAGSPIYTRNAYAVGGDIEIAADFLATEYTRFGFTAAQETFRADMGPNVIATKRGILEPDVYVILGAHYDSRSTNSGSTTQRAPGANDDGSGTGALLEIARVISNNNIQFRYSVILGSWCGEEQGLIGSRAYAQKSRNNDMDILAMFQADMIAYRVTTEQPQCAFPNRNDDKDLTALAEEVVNTYVPQLQTCLTTACCSDHQSFTEQGYSATQIFERCNSIADNQYHQSGDLVDRPNYDQNQLTLNTKAMFANLLVVAEAL